MNRTSSLRVSSMIRLHTTSTFRSKERSACTKTKVPSGHDRWHSSIIIDARTLFLPIIYTIGYRAFVASALSVDSPIPLVAPAKTATRRSALAFKAEFDRRTSVRLTIMKNRSTTVEDVISGGKRRGQDNKRQDYTNIDGDDVTDGRFGVSALRT